MWSELFTKEKDHRITEPIRRTIHEISLVSDINRGTLETYFKRMHRLSGNERPESVDGVNRYTEVTRSPSPHSHTLLWLSPSQRTAAVHGRFDPQGQHSSSRNIINNNNVNRLVGKTLSSESRNDRIRSSRSKGHGTRSTA